VLVVYCVLLGVAAWVFSGKNLKMAYVFFTLAAMFGAIGIYHFAFRSKKDHEPSSMT